MVEWKNFNEGLDEICRRVQVIHGSGKPVLVTIMGDPNSGKTFHGRKLEDRFKGWDVWHEEKDMVYIPEHIVSKDGSPFFSQKDLVIYTMFSERRYTPEEMARIGGSGNFSGYILDSWGREQDLRVYISRTGTLDVDDREAIDNGHYQVVIFNPDAKVKGQQ